MNEEILEFAKHDALIHLCVENWRKKEWTWEETLEAMNKGLRLNIQELNLLLREVKLDTPYHKDLITLSESHEPETQIRYLLLIKNGMIARYQKYLETRSLKTFVIKKDGETEMIFS